MKVVQFSVSELSLLEARHNTVSLINILEEINTFSFPAVAPKLSICFIAKKEENEPDSLPATLQIRLGRLLF
jgi:hypothetical protein